MNARSSSPFWIWAPYSGEPGIAFVTEISGLDDDSGRLLRGEPLPDRLRPVVEQCDPGTFTDMLGSYTGLPILAPNLVAVLQAAGARIALVPLTVPEEPGRDYAIVNVLDTVPTLDLAASTLTMFEGTDVIDRITHLVLQPIPADAPPIFHAAEHPVLILVNDALRRQLQAASDHPGVLTPVGKWRNVL